MDEKRIRTIEDNYLMLQNTQKQILEEIKGIKECSINKEEMELANEKLVERIFTKVEKNFARKEKIENMEKNFADKEKVESIERSLRGIIGAILTISVSVVIYLLQNLITMI